LSDPLFAAVEPVVAAWVREHASGFETYDLPIPDEAEQRRLGLELGLEHDEVESMLHGVAVDVLRVLAARGVVRTFTAQLGHDQRERLRKAKSPLLRLAAEREFVSASPEAADAALAEVPSALSPHEL
jgi:hypothetical protein